MAGIHLFTSHRDCIVVSTLHCVIFLPPWPWLLFFYHETQKILPEQGETEVN